MSNINILDVINLDRDKVLLILKEEEKLRFSQDYIDKCNLVSNMPNGWLEVTSELQKNLVSKYGYSDIITNALALNVIRSATKYFPNDDETKNSVVHFRENKAKQGTFKLNDIIPNFNFYTNKKLKIDLYSILDSNKTNIILAGSHT